MALDFDELFKVPMMGLWLMRTHPYLKRTKIWFFQAFVVAGLFTLIVFIIIYNIFYHDFVNRNFETLCKNTTLTLVWLMAATQYSVMIIEQKALLKLISHVKTDYQLLKYLDEKEQALVLKYSKEAEFICKYWFYIGSIAPQSFVVKSVGLMLYYYCIGEPQLVNYYELIYPKFIEDVKSTNVIVFCLIYFLMIYYGYCSGIMFASFVPLGPTMMLHASGQLEIVRKRIEELFEELDDEVILFKIKCIAKQLKYIYSFVDLIQDVFRIAYEVALKVTTIILPITSYEVLEALERGELSVEFFSFIIGGVLISSSPCYFSDLLLEKGDNVRLALYTCGWEQHYDSPRIRSNLLVLLICSRRPIAIRTLFKTMCLETLADLFQQAYTIFNLMNAMLK